MTDRRFIHHHQLDDNGDTLKVQCRFCRSLRQYNRFDYVAPCGCQGPSRFVHRACLSKWIVLKFQHVYNQPDNGEPEQFNVFCEVCQQKMEIRFTIKRKFCSYQDFVEKILDMKFLFGILVLFTVLALSAMIFIIVWCMETGYSTIIANQAQLIILAVGFAISIILALICIFFFLFIFLIIKSIDIDKIPNHKQPLKLINFNGDEIFQEDEGVQNYRNPHFGGPSDQRSRQINIEKSIIHSKFNQGDKRSQQSDKNSSVASKTLTDYVMKDIYKHEEELEIDKRGVKEVAKVDQQLQVDMQMLKKQNQMRGHPKFPMQESKAFSKLDNQFLTVYARNQQNKSVEPKSSLALSQSRPKNNDKNQRYFVSDMAEQKMDEGDSRLQERQIGIQSRRQKELKPIRQKIPERERRNQQQRLQKDVRSKETLIEPKKSKIKLKGDYDPIKIRLMF